MRGKIMQRGKRKNSWTIILDLDRGSDGKRNQKWIAVQGTKKDAERKLAELVHMHDKGLPLDSSKLTVAVYLASWLRDVVSVRNRPKTQEGYRYLVDKHITPAMGGLALGKLQPADVQHMEAAVLASGLSANTAHHVHVVLRKALKDAMRSGLVHRNVCDAVQAPSPGRYEVHLPNPEDVQRMLEAAWKTEYGAVFHFIAFTGVRRGEAVALKWENVDLDRRVVSITATAQALRGKGTVVDSTKSAAGRRAIDLDANTVDMLREHQGKQLLRKIELEGVYEENGLVFPGPRGRILSPPVLTRNFEKIAQRVGVAGVRLHDLRHHHAAGLVRAGVHQLVVQKRLGHGSAAFTMQVYGHVAPGLQAQAAEAFAKLMGPVHRPASE